MMLHHLFPSKMEKYSYLLNQPNELIIEQCQRMSNQELARFLRTNKRIYTICKDILAEKRRKADTIEQRYRNCILQLVQRFKIPLEDLLVRGTSFNRLLQKYRNKELNMDVVEDMLNQLDREQLEEYVEALDTYDILDAGSFYNCFHRRNLM